MTIPILLKEHSFYLGLANTLDITCIFSLQKSMFYYFYNDNSWA